MKSDFSRLTLCGHFEAFELPTSAQRETVVRAKELGDPIGILVGDIGIRDKIRSFCLDQQRGIFELYSRRIRCSNSDCVRIQLPREGQINRRVDWEMLEKFSRQTESNLEHLHLPVEHLSARHLNFFGLDIGEVKLFSERQLRNIASRRLAGSRKNRPSSWWTILKQLEVTDALILSQELEFSGGHHSCKAILLSLLESVHAQGFSRLHWVAEPQLFRALSGVSRLLSILKSAEIETSLTQLNFSFEITGDSFYSDLTLSKDNYANI